MRIFLVAVLLVSACSFLPYKLVEHKVEEGDTLHNIAQRYQTTVKEVARLNKIADSRELDLGAILLVRISKSDTVEIKFADTNDKKKDKKKDKKQKESHTEVELKSEESSSQAELKSEESSGQVELKSEESSSQVELKSEESNSQVELKSEEVALEQENTIAQNQADELEAIVISALQEYDQATTETFASIQMADDSATASTLVTEPQAVEEVIDWQFPITPLTAVEGIQTEPNSEGKPQLKITLKKSSYIVAAESGEVTYTGSGLKHYGRLIVVEHEDNFITAYGNLSKVLVDQGDAVRQNQKIAQANGNNKIIFEIRDNGVAIDVAKIFEQILQQQQ